MPRTSIITPLYNGAPFISDCIASVQAQADGDYEHLIVDNMSTDGGREIALAAAKADPRIRVLENTEGRGAGPTRNVALGEASGKFLAFLDADDLWRPRKLEAQLAHMQKNDLGLSWTAYEIFSQTGPIRVQPCKPSLSRRDFLAKRGVLGCLTVMIDQGKVEDTLVPDIAHHEDFVHWHNIMRQLEDSGVRWGGLDEVLADYRVHHGGISASKAQAAKMHWAALRYGVGLGLIPASLYFSSYAFNTIKDRIKV